jgi:hypothetical protein
MRLDCEGSEREREREREREQLPMFLRAAMSSSTVQQVKLPCTTFDSLLDHKSSSSSNSSTTTWRRGRLLRKSLQLRVCVHPQFYFTHQQILQCTALLPRAHGIETEAAIRGHGNCKLSYSSSLCVCLLPSFHSPSHSTCGWLVYLPKAFDLNLIGSKLKNWTSSVQDAEPRGGFYVIKLYDFERKFFCSPCRSERETVAGVLFGSFAMVGSQI